MGVDEHIVREDEVHGSIFGRVYDALNNPELGGAYVGRAMDDVYARATPALRQDINAAMNLLGSGAGNANFVAALTKIERHYNGGVPPESLSDYSSGVFNNNPMC